MSITIVHGIPEAMRSTAVALFDAAFGAKFGLGIPSRPQRVALLSDAFDLSFAVGAIDGETLVGLAGYKTENGSFTEGMTYEKLLEHAGILRGNWAAIVFSLYERPARPHQLLIDGIVVDEGRRGQGIGAQLLDASVVVARASGCTEVLLDVIDTNVGARRLYERSGFVATETQHFEYLRSWLGFGASTTMIRTLDERKID